jgi:hypothetical protein
MESIKEKKKHLQLKEKKGNLPPNLSQTSIEMQCGKIFWNE